MSVNDSSSTNSSTSNFTHSSSQCFVSIIYNHIGFSFTKIFLLLPLSVLVLTLGFQQWKQRSVSSTAVMSFSDFFTYNIAVIELIGVLGDIISIYGYLAKRQELLLVTNCIPPFIWSGQMYFPILTCVERHLAVVHPITYLQLKRGTGVLIRNISTGLIWLLCFQGMCLMIFFNKYAKYMFLGNIFLMVFFLIIVTFCSFSVLRVLIRPRPGEVGGDRGRVDQSKRKAFQTIIIIWAVLLLRFGGSLIGFLLIYLQSNLLLMCVGSIILLWLTVPSSLVLPLLFLHRKGKLTGCKHQ